MEGVHVVGSQARRSGDESHPVGFRGKILVGGTMSPRSGSKMCI